MIAIIFELWPAEGRADDYFGLAAALKPELERIDGFISVERFQSLAEPGKAALALLLPRRGRRSRAWRNLPGHRDRAGAGPGRHLRRLSAARRAGRCAIMARQVRDEAPRDSRQAHG